VITDPAHAREDGSPDDVDREFTTLWMVFNEAHEGAPEDSVEPHLKHCPGWSAFHDRESTAARR